MPSLTSLPLSLSEVLEARRGPLDELEIWALLCQCTERLQDLVINGQVDKENYFRYLVAPNSLLIRDNGTVTLVDASDNLQGSVYMAPELDFNPHQSFTDTAHEKMFVYSLGRTLQVASEFGLNGNEVLSISYDLDSLLQAMTERNAVVRLGLIHILEACALQSTQHPLKPPHMYTLSKMYKSILTTESQMSTHVGRKNENSQMIHDAHLGRARRPRRPVRHRHGEESCSRLRSRSRSRSSDRGHKPRDAPIYNQEDPHLDKRTHPVSSILNTSISSSVGNFSAIGANQPPSFMQAPSLVTAAHSVQGLLGQRNGSPAYQKYIQLKERQIRLRQARSGQGSSALQDVRSRLMTSGPVSHEGMDNMSETRSMASLMSYTLGNYKPDLHSQYGSNVALDLGKGAETDADSTLDSQLSLLLATSSGENSLGFTPVTSAPTEQISSESALPAEEQDYQTQTSNAQPQATTSSEPLLKKENRGPEHVINLMKPAIQVDMPVSTEHSKSGGIPRPVTIVHLTGQRVEVRVDPYVTSRQLFDIIIPIIDLDDFFFFGLTYISDGEHFFVDGQSKIHKVAPEGWKEGSKSHYTPAPFVLFVRVKFYPDSLTDFRHTSSYHLLYLQLRQDVVEERIICDLGILARLAGLALQVEYGDQDGCISEGVYFSADHYVPSKVIRRHGAAYVYTKVVEGHKACAGIPSSMAEIEFIKRARNLPEYGIHFYKLFKSKLHTLDSHMWAGLTQHSLVLAGPSGVGRTITHDYPWGNIMKISFNKRRFSVQPKTEVVKGKPPKLSFYANSYRTGKYLLQFSTELHRFQIRMRTRPSNFESLAGDLSVEMERHTVDTGVGNDVVDCAMSLPDFVDPCQQPLPDDDDDDFFDEPEPELTGAAEPALQYHSPPPYQPPRMAQVLGGLHAYPDLEELQTFFSGISVQDKQQLHMLFETSTQSSSLDITSANSNLDKKEPSPPYSSPKFSYSDPLNSRDIFEVTLIKEDTIGIGLTIVGGEATNSLDLGIFVKSVTKNGPAFRDKRIKPGDRIIAINGTSLEGKQHHEAVTLIRDGGSIIFLLISQIRNQPFNEGRNFEPDKAIQQFYFRSDDYRGDDSLKDDHYENGRLLKYDDFVNSYTQNTHNNINFSNDLLDSNKKFNLNDSICTQHIFLPSNQTQCTEQQLQERQNSTFTDSVYSSPNTAQKYLTELKTIPFKNSEQSPDFKLIDEEELCRLLSEERLNESEGASQKGTTFPENRLTVEDRDLQLLGDIAALDNNDSSSDSDFETAVWKAIESPRNVDFHVEKSIDIPVDIQPKSSFNSRRNSETDVMYEVILEKQNESLGITLDTPHAEESPSGRFFVKDVIPGSSAEHGGILAPGDELLEICGNNLSGMTLKEVTKLIDISPILCTIKFVRPKINDDAQTENMPLRQSNTITEFALQDYSLNNNLNTFQPLMDQTHAVKVKDQPRKGSVSKLIASPPKNSTQPLEGDLVIVPPPPPLTFSMDGSASNTQSDVDSDVLDSSRSELESIYKNAEIYLCSDQGLIPQVALEEMTEKDIKEKNQKSETLLQKSLKLPNAAIENSSKVDNINYDNDNTSTDFQQHLAVLENELDAHLKAEVKSASSPSRSSNLSPSSAGSVIKVIQTSIDTKSNFDEQETNDEDESSVGGKYSLTDISEVAIDVNEESSLNMTLTNDSALINVKERAKQLERQLNGDDVDPFEPELIKISLQKISKTFGFTVAGGMNTGGCYIKQLVADPAISDGRLRPGDRIVQVNGQDTTMMSHIEAVSLLRKISDVVTLHLLRYPSSFEMQERFKKIQNDAFAFTKQSEETLMKEAHNGNSSKKTNSVKDLFRSDTPKAIIKPYVYINKLNETAVEEESEISKNVIDLHEDVKKITTDTEMTVLRIEINKPLQPHSSLGLGLMEEQMDGLTGIFVKRIQKQSLVDVDGQIQIGDQILQANNISFMGMTQKAAGNVLRELHGKIVLTISRSNSHEEKKTLTTETEQAVKLFLPDLNSYQSPRELPVDLPSRITEEWLDDLPLIEFLENIDEDYATDILQSLADLVEKGEPYEEFKHLRQIEEENNCDAGKLIENKGKNRYKNVLPYDKNRVKLEKLPSDYINASHINVQVGNCKMSYIASQGPSSDTVSDFWVMVWQQGAAAVAMLTQVNQSGKVKCHTYWPDQMNQPLSIYNDTLIVTLISEYTVSDYCVVDVHVEEPKSKQYRKVTLLQYLDWPDHGAPETALPLLKLLQLLHLFERGAPAVVHCSAGIGRTGTLIAIDVALATFERGLEFDMYKIVRNLRTQRHGMIQTTDQYLFCYTACMEALLSLEYD